MLREGGSLQMKTTRSVFGGAGSRCGPFGFRMQSREKIDLDTLHTSGG